MSERKIVWALFDSEASCCQEALKDVAEVYSFGIGTGNKHIELDLSDFETAKKELDKYPKPDYIFASPPCETWVGVSRGNLRFFTKEKGHNLYWRNKWEPFDFTEKYKEKRINGINTAATTVRLIRCFSPRFWAIENGNTSWIFDYIYRFTTVLMPGFRNKCNYFSYGFDVLKLTIIYSNKLLILRNFKPTKRMPGNIENMQRSCSSLLRSLVPFSLYHDIYRQFEHGGQKTLFKEAI